MIYRLLSRIVLITFFVVAGLNHFINPDFYLDLIPKYLPFHKAINMISGFLEIIMGLSLIPLQTRKAAKYAIIVLLILFIPSHIYFINIGSCINNGLCIPEWIAWMRLLIIHPLLILWVWSQK